MKKYKYLFFDLDRTLWDYETNATHALDILYKKYALDKHYTSFDAFNKLFSHYNDFLWAEYREGRVHKDILRTLRFVMCFKHAGFEDSALAVNINHDFLEISPRSEHVMPGTFEILDYLRNKQYRMYIITNGFTQIQEMKMKYSGLESYFEKMFTSESAGSSKPHPDMFTHCLTSVNARKQESLMIGDDLPVDIVGARKFGFDQVYYNPEATPHTEQVTYEIRHLSELKKIL